MRPATTPSQPPAAPQITSMVFQTNPSPDPRTPCTISIAAEYAATSAAARSAARPLGASALSAVNPTTAKAAMLYALRNTTWNESACGDVTSYTSLLVAAQNSTAATMSASQIRGHLASVDPGEPS